MKFARFLIAFLPLLVAEGIESSTSDELSSEYERQQATCYAKRYPSLFEAFCGGNEETCEHERLAEHYRQFGQDMRLIWGCRDRQVVSAQAVSLSAEHDDLPDPELHVLVFETNPEHAEEMTLLLQAENSAVKTTVFGVGVEFQGFGTKWSAVQPVLQSLPEDSLVAIVDGRDVMLNIHQDSPEKGRDILQGFAKAFKALELKSPEAVFMGAEGQCCVAALTHAEPGAYFDENGNRVSRACSSGEEGCEWAGDQLKLPWEDFQQKLAKAHTGLELEDAYLNAGLVAGRANRLLSLVEAASIEASEDDQAVFTDLMYQFPDRIVLDYAQQMFGIARWEHGMTESGCPFGTDSADSVSSLTHKETGTSPLFLHFPGKFFQCMEYAKESVGYGVVGRKLVSGGLRGSSEDAGRELTWWRNKCNYVCPANSSQKPHRACYDNFHDCECDHGFKKSGGSCIPDGCNYVCPANSSQKPYRACYDTFDDCECDHGFKKSGESCIPDGCNYVCPANSSQKPYRSCYDTFDDCECDHGFKKSGESCIPDGCNFVCPANSSQKPYRFCYDTFDDCQCDHGYEKEGEMCVRDRCNQECPANSVRKPNRACYDTFSDCECIDGYEKDGGMCKPVDNYGNFIRERLLLQSIEESINM